MSERLQFGGHPDADQLSAFTENALPPHERQAMLAHLAACAECRDVVAFSLPPLETAPPAPERRRWFSRVTLLWPAAALAAAAGLLIYVHYMTTSVRETGAVNQVADIHAPSPPLSNGANAPAPHAAPPTAASQPLAGNPVKKQPPQDQSPEGVVAHLAGQSQPDTRNASVAALAGHAAQPVVTEATAQAAAAPPAAPSPQGFVAGGLAGGSAATAPTQLHGTVTATGNGAGLGIVRAAPPQTALAATAQLAVTAPAPETDASAGAASSLDGVSDASADDALSAEFIPPYLPSGAAILSTAVRGRQMVAIDARNVVFLSNDGGVHWAAVSVPWKGRAVHAELVSSPTASPALARTQAMTGAAVYGVAAAPPPKPSAKAAAKSATIPVAATEPPGSLSGRVTDPAGAVIAGAAITVTGTTGQVLSTVETGRDGRYVVGSLPAGAYDLKAVARGFEVATLHAVPISAAVPSIENLTLQVGAATETVTVAAAPPIVELQSNTAPAIKARNKTMDQGSPAQEKLFAITTDTGERWTSADGVTWQRR